jgi:Fibronectin type III domain
VIWQQHHLVVCSSLSITKGAGTALEIGAVLTSAPKNKGARLSRIAATLTYTPLAAPTSLAGSTTTSSTLGLSWTDTSSNEDGFNVERSTDGTIWTPIASTSANESSFEDTGLTASTTYYYRVRAFNSGAYTAYTNVATTTTADVGVLAWWNMNGSVGSSPKKADDGPSGLTLTEHNNPTSGPGRTLPQTDGAYVLNGSTQYLSSADTGFVTNNGARTIKAWV